MPALPKAVEYRDSKTSQNLLKAPYEEVVDPIDKTKQKWPPKRNIYAVLAKQFKNDESTNAIIVIGRVQIKVHMLILRTYSKYFRNFPDPTVSKFKIKPKNCSADAFRIIYNWMRSDDENCYKTLITRQNILSIYIGSRYLKIKILQKQLWSIMVQEKAYDEGRAYNMYIEAQHQNLPEVAEIMLPRIKTFFVSLVGSLNFLQLSFPDLKKILTSDDLKVQCEGQIFYSAMRWIKHDPVKRLPLKVELMNCIRFENMCLQELFLIKIELASQKFFEIIKNEEIATLIKNGIRFAMELEHNNCVLEEQGHRPMPLMEKGVYQSFEEFLMDLDNRRMEHLTNC